MARHQSATATRKIFLRVEFKDNDAVRALGAGFESYKGEERPPGAPRGYWYIKPGELIAPFARWKKIGNPFAPDPTKLPAKTFDGKNAAAVALGSLGGRAGGHKGGKARARNRSAEELSAIGRKGAQTRWAKVEAERRQKLDRDRSAPPIPAFRPLFDDDTPRYQSREEWTGLYEPATEPKAITGMAEYDAPEEDDGFECIPF